MVEHGTIRLNRRRVNPERMKAYRQRVMSRPDASYTLTREEQDQVMAWEDAWRRGNDDAPAMPFHDWRESVAEYAKVKGIQTTWTELRDPSTQAITISWRERHHG